MTDPVNDQRQLVGDSLITHKQAVDTFVEYAAKVRANPKFIDEGTHYTRAELNEVFKRYAELCQFTGLAFDVVIAQLAHETGWGTSWWAGRPRRNPAGIGVTGFKSEVRPKVPAEWHARLHMFEAGIAFDSWVESCQAHVGRLLGYRYAKGTSLPPLATSLIAVAEQVRPIGAARGCALVLRDLGKEANPKKIGWAISAKYGEKLAEKINIMAAAASLRMDVNKDGNYVVTGFVAYGETAVVTMDENDAVFYPTADRDRFHRCDPHNPAKTLCGIIPEHPAAPAPTAKVECSWCRLYDYESGEKLPRPRRMRP